MQKIIFSLLFITYATMGIVAQNQEKPCSRAEANQMDFWIGEWDLEWKSSTGKVQNGTSVVTKILDGCVILEEFNGGKDLPLRGISHSMFDESDGNWKQTWVDNSGSYLDFVGGMIGDEMTLVRSFDGKDGKGRMQKMVFLNIENDSLEWRWESSTDEGSTWNLVWHIKYTRKK